MRKSTFPKMYVWHMPFDEGVAMSPKGVEPALSSMKKSIQIAYGFFKKSVSKTEFQDILKFLPTSQEPPGYQLQSNYYQLLYKYPQWPAFLLTPKVVLPKEEQDQEEKRPDMLSQDNKNMVVVQAATNREKNIRRHQLRAEKRFLLY